MNQSYRADIDGLRAVAAALVLLYHFQFSAVSGGFVGVDVFFVITGFVMTNLLLKQLRAGSFVFSDFYAKRLKRLLPAFLVVSFVTFVCITPIYLDGEYYIFAKSWLESLIGYSNFYYIEEFSKYFSPNAEIQPLLHTWSLAVEFQFYLIWPLVLMATHRFINKKASVWMFVLLWSLAFGYAVYRTDMAPGSAYYLTTVRLFELLMGVGIALFPQRLPQLNRFFAELLATLGLVLIVGSSLIIKKGALFPSYNALAPVGGAALIIYAGMHAPGSFVGRLLSNRVMVYLGALSYSVYLWHWPMVAVLNFLMIELTPGVKLALIAASIFMGWLSYTFVESRLRYRNWSFRKSLVLLVLIPAVFIWAVQVAVRLSDDTSVRLSPRSKEIYQLTHNQDASEVFKSCISGDEKNFDRSERCIMGAQTQDGQPNAVLIGDSHANSYAGFIEELSKDSQFRILQVTKSSTPFILSKDSEGLGDKQVRSKALEEYMSGSPMTVFMAARWHGYLKGPAYARYFINATAWLIEKGHKVVILEDVPGLPSDTFSGCILRSSKDCTVSQYVVEQEKKSFRLLRTKLEKIYPQVSWINPRDAMCDGSRCVTGIDKIPLYRDSGHMTYSGSKALARRYRQMFGNPLLTP